MPPPEQAPPAEIEAEQGQDALLKQGVVVVSEAAGWHSKVAVPRVQWPKWTQLSKRDPKLMLSQMSCNVEAEVGLSPEEWLMLPSQKS